MPDYLECDRRKLRKMTHMETFHYDVFGDMRKKMTNVLFDYQKRNPINHQAEIIVIE